MFKTVHLSSLSILYRMNEIDIRYMLLHELQHYRYKDGIVNYLMNLAGMILLVPSICLVCAERNAQRLGNCL